MKKGDKVWLWCPIDHVLYHKVIRKYEKNTETVHFDGPFLHDLDGSYHRTWASKYRRALCKRVIKRYEIEEYDEFMPDQAAMMALYAGLAK